MDAHFRLSLSCRITLRILAAALLVTVHLWGLRGMWDTNPDKSDDGRRKYDQSFYLMDAKLIAIDEQKDPPPRSRMPLFPWLISLLWKQGLTDEEFFHRAKVANAALSVILLGVIFRVFRCWMTEPLAWLLTLLATWRVLIFKAIIVQPETLFYVLYLCSFALMMTLLQRPNWRLALLSGGVVGITHLTKGSALPMIGLFALCGLSRFVLAGWKDRKKATHEARHWGATGAAFGLAFLAVTGTFLWNTSRHYGSPFYDPNSRYYFWAGSPEEMGAMQKTALAWEKPYVNRFSAVTPELEKWLSVWAGPAKAKRILDRAIAGHKVPLSGAYDILPSRKHYFAQHSLSDAMSRLSDGTKFMLMRNLEHRDGYGRPLLWLWGEAAVVGIALAVRRWAHFVSLVAKIRWPVFFALASVFGCFALYGWWAPVSNRNRFFLTQYLPMLLCTGAWIGHAGRLLPGRLQLTMPKLLPRLGGRKITLTPTLLLQVAVAVLVIAELFDPRLGKLVQ